MIIHCVQRHFIELNGAERISFLPHSARTNSYTRCVGNAFYCYFSDTPALSESYNLGVM